MSNKSMKEVMTEEVVEVLQTALRNHVKNQKANKNDTRIMQETIKDLEAYVRQFVKSDFEHFNPGIYTSLGLPPPAKAKIDTQPKPESPVKTSSVFSEEDTESSASNKSSPRSNSETNSPRIKQPEPLIQEDYYDSEETGQTVNVEEFTDDSRSYDSESPRTTEENQLVEKLPSSAPAVQQSWAAERSRRPPQQPAPPHPNITLAAKSTMLTEKIYIMNVIAGANKIHPDKKTVAIVNALISAQNDLRENKITPADALKTIVDNIGTKKKIKGVTVLVLSKNESNFLKEFMKIPSLQDVIKDRASLAILQNMAQSLPKNKRDVILNPLESVKEAPTQTIKFGKGK